MFDQFVDSIKEKIDDISNTVDVKIKESREQIERDDADKSVLCNIISLYDEANASVSKLFDDEESPKQHKKQPINHRQYYSNSSNGPGPCKGRVSRSTLGDEEDDDLYGYNLSDDTSCEEDELGDMPLIKKQMYRDISHAGGRSKSPNLSDLGGQPLPRYALPSSYLKAEEVCKRRVTTTKRITEADLDTNSPLYRHRDKILEEEDGKGGPHSPNMMSSSDVSTCFILYH